MIGLAGPIAGLFGGQDWRFDLANHFLVQETLLLFVTSVVLLAAKRFFRFFISLAVLLLCLGTLWPYLPLGQESLPSTPLTEAQKVTLLVLNVHRENTAYEKTIQLIEKTNADILVLMEIDKLWEKELATALKERYPISESVARDDNFGIALYSKVAMKKIDTVYMGKAVVPSLRTTLVLEGKEVVFWATHPLPPVSVDYWLQRNEQLLLLAGKIIKDGRPAIVAGDLNSTPWSSWMRPLKNAGLKDGSLGKGFHPTWPTVWPAALRIPIDHVFASDGVKILSKKVLEDVGSDHLPLWTEWTVFSGQPTA